MATMNVVTTIPLMPVGKVAMDGFSNGHKWDKRHLDSWPWIGFVGPHYMTDVLLMVQHVFCHMGSLLLCMAVKYKVRYSKEILG